METKKSSETLITRIPLYAIVAALWLAYAALNFSTPSKQTTNIYHLSIVQLDLLRLSFIVPYLIIWLLAAYAFIKLRDYVSSLGETAEAQGYSYISRGILLLLGGLSFSAISSSLRQFVIGDHFFQPALTILTNYFYVFPYLASFLCFYAGVRCLLKGSNFPNVPPTRFLFYILPLLAFTYIWLDLIFTNPLRYTSPSAILSATYYLSDSLIVLTIVMPLFLAWCLALLTVIFLRHYYERTRGKIYRSSLVYLVRGAVGVTFGSIFLQGILSLGPGRLQNLGLGSILLIVYFFLILQGVGFAYIAMGANRLRRIETA